VAEQGKSSWTALIGALTGALLSSASLAFFFGSEMRQIATNRQSITEIQVQLKNGRDALITQNARLGVLEARVDDLRREVAANRGRPAPPP
jgi:hypothetical protein